MNVSTYTYLLNHPKNIDKDQVEQLDQIVVEFPYFQSARALQLKGLKDFNSFKYNQALKVTAAHTIDRTILFDFITSNAFGLVKEYRSKEIEVQEENEVVDTDFIKKLHQKVSKSTKSSIAIEIGKSIEDNKEIDKRTEDILKLGTPLKFRSGERHSFNEWMQLCSFKKIERNAPSNATNGPLQEKYNIIDKFIENNPKISPIDKSSFTSLETSKAGFYENENLMTETLAKVYLEQKKYESAIKAYHILSLKYPEKSTFFADRIKAIKIIQKNRS